MFQNTFISSNMHTYLCMYMFFLQKALAKYSELEPEEVSVNPT